MKKDIKIRVARRLKILEGQIRGLQKMVAKEEYCVDILQQSSAAKNALSSIEDLILENHLEVHAVEQAKHGKAKQAVKEILSIYKLSKQR